MTIEKIANLRGPQGEPGDRGEKGDTGTFAGASAETVSSSESAEVIMHGPETSKQVHFKIPAGPQGLPGVNAVENDDAVAGYIGSEGESATKDAVIARARSEMPTVDIRWFGAVGDGVTDDTLAVRAFFTHLATVGGAGVATGWFRITGPMIISDNDQPFSFDGGGEHSTEFIMDGSAALNGPTLRNLENATLANFTVRGAEAEKLVTGVSAAGLTNVTIEKVTVFGPTNAGIIVSNSQTITHANTNCVVRECTVFGEDVARNGVLIGNADYCRIVDCRVFDLTRTDTPSFGLQLKNRTAYCEIIGGVVSNAIAGVALGNEDGESVHRNARVRDVTAVACARGFNASNATGCDISMFIEMSGADEVYAVRLAENFDHSRVSVDITGMATTTTPVFVRGTGNRVVFERLRTIPSRLAHIHTEAGMTTIDLLSSAPYSVINLLDRIAIEDPNSVCSLYVQGISSEQYSVNGGVSYSRFSTPGNINTDIQYNHGNNEFRTRIRGDSAYAISADAIRPLTGSANRDLGTTSTPFHRLYVKDAVVVRSVNGTSYRVTVDAGGNLVASPLP